LLHDLLDVDLALLRGRRAVVVVVARVAELLELLPARSLLLRRLHRQHAQGILQLLDRAVHRLLVVAEALDAGREVGLAEPRERRLGLPPLARAVAGGALGLRVEPRQLLLELGALSVVVRLLEAVGDLGARTILLSPDALLLPAHLLELASHAVLLRD